MVVGVGGVEGRMRGGVIGRGFAVRRERVDGIRCIGYRYSVEDGRCIIIAMVLYTVCVKPS